MNITYSLGKQEESHHLTLVDYSLRLPRNAEFRKPKGPVSIRRPKREVVAIAAPPRETQRQISAKGHESQVSSRTPSAVKAITDGAENPSQAQERLETARKYIEVCEESQRATIRFEELRKRRKLHCHLEELLRAAAIRAVKVKESPSGGDNDGGDGPSGDHGEEAGGNGGNDHKPHRRHHHRRHGGNDQRERNPHHRHHHKHGRQHQDGSYSDSELSYSDYSDSNSEYMDDVEYMHKEEEVPKQNYGRFDVRRYSAEGNNFSNDASSEAFVSRRSTPDDAKVLEGSVEKEEPSRRLSSKKSSSEAVKVCAEHIISHNISERDSSNIDVLVMELEPSCKISNSPVELIASEEKGREGRSSEPVETNAIVCTDDVVPFDSRQCEEEQPHDISAQPLASKEISKETPSEKTVELLELEEKEPSTKASSNEASSKKEGSNKSSPAPSKSTDSWISERSQKLRKDLIHKIIMEAMALPSDESDEEDEYDRLIAEVMAIPSSEARDTTPSLRQAQSTPEVVERMSGAEMSDKKSNQEPSERSSASPGPCGCRTSDDVQNCRSHQTAGLMDEVMDLYMAYAEEFRPLHDVKADGECYSQHSSWSEDDPNYLSEKQAAELIAGAGAAAVPSRAAAATAVVAAPPPAAANPSSTNVSSYPKKQDQPLRAPSKKMKERRPNEIEETGCFC